MAKQYKSLHATKYYRDYLAHNIRPDGREFDKFRPVIVNAGSLTTADGSAVAKIGRTTVVCGIKAELCRPKAEKADQGFLIPNIDLPPLCSSKFRPGPPCDQAQVSTQLIADIIENSKCISLEDLCIANDKLAWCLFADIICLDFDGAVIDACLVALIAALKSVTLPMVEYDATLDNKEVNISDRKPIKIHNIPVSTSFAIFEDKILLTDPTVEEENLSSGIVNIVVKNDELCLVHKPGGSPLSEEVLINCIQQSKERAVLINNLINTALKEIT